MLKVAESEKERLRRMQQVAGNIGLINPLVFNHFGYGTYAQVKIIQRKPYLVIVGEVMKNPDGAANCICTIVWMKALSMGNY